MIEKGRRFVVIRLTGNHYDDDSCGSDDNYHDNDEYWWWRKHDSGNWRRKLNANDNDRDNDTIGLYIAIVYWRCWKHYVEVKVYDYENNAAV